MFRHVLFCGEMRADGVSDVSLCAGQDVSVEGLLQSTGLSPTVLLHALSPLTAEKGVLTHDSPDSDPSKGTCFGLSTLILACLFKREVSINKRLGTTHFW